ncbi:uncharacterized protein LOC129578440 isoform X2 [Sitodiplosis mosellana]|uniref:uncharacterized protein LOC129578440 isoform X2 n=1 Tax=Sitodiplosis mosellana TaxID=263140 RepID=UPI002443D348|nr:uncharacterized protein LOC129578440 isoform X2 [Sitodiplosis mosellana]
MQLFFKEELNIYRKMFCRESKKSVSGMEILDEFVRKVHESAMCATNIHDIQRSIRLLSIFCEILQTFNMNVETLVSSIDAHIYNEVVANSTNTICLRMKDWLADLSSYQIGDKFTGVISYVLDGDTKLCFIKDQERYPTQDFKDFLESAFDGIPSYGHVFALQLNQKFFRAIRIDSESTNMAIRVRLIDIGETISVSPHAYKYNLVDEAKRLPPMAILCRVGKFDGKVLNSLNTLYKRTFEVKITDICVNMLEVELGSELDNERDAMNDSIQKSIIECFENSDHNEVQQPPLTPTIARSATVTPNPFLMEFTESNGYRPQTPILNGNHTAAAKPLVSPAASVVSSVAGRPPLPPVPPRQRPKALPQIRIPIDIIRRGNKVYEQGKTENNNHVDAEAFENTPKISPEKIEPKLNGAHPKVPSVRLYNGISFKEIREGLLKPSIGEEKAVTPTHIISAEYMYVQFNDWFQRFQDFHAMIQSLQPKQLSYIPKLNDYVLARYNDGLMYRARVEAIEQRNVTVFYMDYGNTEQVELDALFEWDTECNQFPLQAVKCRLANIRSLPGSSASKICDFIYSHYLNKTCKAHIVDISDNILLVKLTNQYGRDVIEEISASLFPECIV